jgi:uncharacterized membrane protein
LAQERRLSIDATTRPEPFSATARSPADRAWWDLSEISARRLMIVMVVGYAAIFSFTSALKFWWFGQGHDLVLHEQAIWNTTQGRIFEVTGFVHPSRLFGYDPYLIELLVVPIYALLPSTHTLFVLQSIVIALGGVAVWKIARDAGLMPVLALLMALMYFFYPTVQYTNMDAFRERSFGLCFFLWGFWAFERERWRTFLILLVLLIIVRLEAALFASMWGVYALLRGRSRRWVITPLVLGLGYFFVGNFVFVPLVNGGQPVSYVYEYFAPLGESMGEVLRTAITRPLYTLQTTWTWNKSLYLVLLLLPTAGLALLSPRELVFTLPVLGLNLLATKPQMSDVRYWYSMLLVGPLVVATIISVRRLMARWPRLTRQPWPIILPILLCLLGAQLRPLNPAVSLLRTHESPERRAVAREIIAAIPPDARVAASGRIAPHLLRQYLYYYPLADQSVLPTIDYIVADVASTSFDDPPSRAQLVAVQHSAEWELLVHREGYQLFKRRMSDSQ